MKVSKKRRQELIKKIIHEKRISNQFQIVEELKKYGIKAVQPTIARDLKEIGAVKIMDESGNYVYRLLDETPVIDPWKELKRNFKSFVESIDRAGNLIVIKTIPGTASGIARVIDRLDIDEIVGTLAGDDTIFVAVRDPESCEKIVEKLSSIL
ncbi:MULTISPECIES: arginine repressor [Thermotoga]|uniref:Arginine repressor n=1 Tax=Thermotoga neapolitana TaxID=2337 RepID=Q9KWZ0_THENE|nr:MULTISPECIES: arginine repressor [Thermotoga]MDK2786228.1 transcriptional regulator of arginine metabolism [Thermotoga sp.]CAB85499.1 arginine repressor [Thermotoga neapolitana]KFZ22125.1 arginine repressor ArgR [Thermotoga neapolitana LA10]PLV57364.1 ArgR family transcriptional regulator [Thermotoga sp. SG1]HBF11302.1 arginine repressor [Thermotoga neapolitana]